MRLLVESSTLEVAVCLVVCVLDCFGFEIAFRVGLLELV